MKILLTILIVFIAKKSIGQATFYGSVGSGNNGYSGTSSGAPKLTLKSLDTVVNASTQGTVNVYLESGGTFRGTDGIALNRGQATFDAYNRDQSGKFHFPILLGTDVFNTGWSLTGSHTYQQNIPNSITLSVGNYAYIYVIEIDTLLEHTAPLTARRYLHYVPSVAAVDTTAGSYFCPLSTPPDNPTLISIHTSDGSSPNNNANYRYEVVTRDRAVNRNLGGSYGSRIDINHLFGMDYGQGPGPFASRQDSFFMNHSIVMGNAIHQMSVGNYSTIDNSAFIAGDNAIDGTSVIFYQVEGANETNTISNSIFMNMVNGVYSHTSHGGGGGVNHGRIYFHNNYAFNIVSGLLAAALTVDTLEGNYCFAKNIKYFMVSDDATISYISNCILQDCETINYLVKNLFIYNTFYRSKTTQSTAIDLAANNHVDLSYSTIHVKTSVVVGDEGGRVINNSDTSERVTAKHNIFIGETLSNAYVNFAKTNTLAGVGTTLDRLDSNVYIMVSGNPRWQVNNSATNGGNPQVLTFANWKVQSGQDQHSIFMDLRNVSGGLDNVFVDAANGNYHLRNTLYADSIRALQAGMVTPVGSFMTETTKEQVRDYIEQDNLPPISNYFRIPPTICKRIGTLIFTP